MIDILVQTKTIFLNKTMYIPHGKIQFFNKYGMHYDNVISYLNNFLILPVMHDLTVQCLNTVILLF